MGGSMGRPMPPAGGHRYEESFAERAARQGGGEYAESEAQQEQQMQMQMQMQMQQMQQHQQQREHHWQREQPYPTPSSRQPSQHAPPMPSLHNQTPEEIAAMRAEQMLINDVRDDLGGVGGDPEQCRNQ